MSTATKFQEVKIKIKEAQEQAKTIAKDAFKEMAAEVFAKHPTLSAFSWTQYTPYFNDGDECVFSARIDEPDVSFVKDGIETTIDGYEVPSGRTWVGGKRVDVELSDDDKEIKLAADDACDLLKNFEDDDLKMMFGDHVEVTVRRDTINIEDYSHD